jgi:hypothetical protein
VVFQHRQLSQTPQSLGFGLFSTVRMMGWWSSGANTALDEQIEKATSSSLYEPPPAVNQAATW